MYEVHPGRFARVCSQATLFRIVCVLLTFVPPFLIAYRSEGFWKRFDWYSEQPRVYFKRHLICLLETNNQSEYVAYGTHENFNRLMEGHVRLPILEYWQEDVNRDGVDDSLELRLTFRLPSTQDIHSVTLLLFFDYRLQKFSRFRMEGMAYIEGNTVLGASEFFYTADLSLRQKVPLTHKGVDTRFNTPIVRSDSIYAEDYDLQQIIRSYSSRNVTTKLTDSYSMWKTGRGQGQPFVISVTIRYPEQLILFKPGFWNVLKWGWVQYVAVLVVFVGLFRHIRAFVFENQVIATVIQMPQKLHGS